MRRPNMTTISALVLVLDEHPERRAGALASLAGDARIVIGPTTAGRVAVVTETRGVREARDLFFAIECTPGVEMVHVVSVDFSDAPAPAPAPAPLEALHGSA
jgi:hypothetical protein